jgi:ABC-type glycerol-3-phosphate transport system substrate-binding protein
MFEENGWEVPNTLEELDKIIAACKEKNITPFATHMVDTWSIGNVTMQFAVNDVFNKTPDWGDKFRAGEVSFESDPDYRVCYEYNKLIYDNTWKDETFSMEQTACDAKMVQGEAAMKVSGSWSIQNFLDIDENFDFGVFPFPNQTGDAKLLFEPNITFMASATSKYQDAIDKVFEVIMTDKDLALEIYDFTKTAPMISGVTPTFPNPSQADIDIYVGESRIQDVNLGNNQLQWGGFQEENAKDIAEYLQGKISLDDALKAADARRDNSKA